VAGNGVKNGLQQNLQQLQQEPSKNSPWLQDG
jgi:hypothetical protein